MKKEIKMELMAQHITESDHNVAILEEIAKNNGTSWEEVESVRINIDSINNIAYVWMYGEQNKDLNAEYGKAAKIKADSFKYYTTSQYLNIVLNDVENMKKYAEEAGFFPKNWKVKKLLNNKPATIHQEVEKIKGNNIYYIVADMGYNLRSLRFDASENRCYTVSFNCLIFSAM